MFTTETTGTANKRPLAIIIKGNPKYLDDPQIKPLAKRFYDTIKTLLQARGFRVEFDAGKALTLPDESAKVWVAHSRGVDRLQYAPVGIQTIALETAGHNKTYTSHDEAGRDPLHYQLSTTDLATLKALHP